MKKSHVLKLYKPPIFENNESPAKFNSLRDSIQSFKFKIPKQRLDSFNNFRNKGVFEFL